MSGYDDDDDDDLPKTTADRLMAWLADEVRAFIAAPHSASLLKRTDIEDANIVWGMLADRLESQGYLVRVLAKQLRETGGEFDDLEEIVMDDIGAIAKAIDKLTARDG